jgi:hypothetical protein
MWYRDVDLHAPNSDEIDVEALTMVHRVQTVEIVTSFSGTGLLNNHVRTFAVKV